MKPVILCNLAKVMNLKSESHSIISGVAVDSRLVKKGDLFFALPGAQTDGHLFLEVVAKTGCEAAVVHSSYSRESFGLILIHSDDVLISLQCLAKTLLQQSKVKVIAVTGSLGKTTTKDFLYSLLSKKFKVACSPGNSNSQIGLPLAILNHTTLEEDILIQEMGMTHPGQIAKLIEIAPPQVAIVTTVNLVHACNFESIDEIALAKAEIFLHPYTELGIFSLESDYGKNLSHTGTCNKVSFSILSNEADFYLKLSDKVMQVTCLNQFQSNNQKEVIELSLLPIPGAHNCHNFLAAAIAANYLGMSWEEINQALSHLLLPERRLQFIEKQGVLFINDAYNASEASVKAALDVLPSPKNGGKKIAVLGSMMELGKFSEDCHKAVGQHALQTVDLMFCFGVECLAIANSWTQAGKPVVWKEDLISLISFLKKELKQGDVVLLKGSRSKAVWTVLDHFE